MTDRPILFSAPMVRALLDGRKTQTRRALGHFDVFTDADGRKAEVSCLQIEGEPLPRVTIGRVVTLKKLKAAVGDRLWVREAWWIATRYSYGSTPGGCDVPPPALAHRRNDPVHYASDGAPQNHANRHYGPGGLRPGSGAFAAPDPYAVWVRKPSIHMPRWASRLTLTVTNVRVERLQDISRGDAMEEGCPFPNMASGPNPRDWYADLWDQINGKGAWDANPWVAAYTFTVEQKNIDEVAPLQGDSPSRDVPRPARSEATGVPVSECDSATLKDGAETCDSARAEQ